MRTTHVLLVAALGLACGGGGDGGTGPTVAAAVTISPGTDITTFTPGSKISLTASVVDAAGVAIPGATTTWTTTDATLLSVSAANGLTTTVTALATGTAKVIATSGPKADTINVTIVAQVFSGVSVTPASKGLAPGSTQALTATAVDQNGVAMSGSGFGAPTFASSNTAVATVTSTGTVTGVADGTATVSATVVAGAVSKSGNSIITVVTGGGFPSTAVVSADGTYGWDPPTVDIAAGGTVTFQNTTTYTHNVTFNATSGAPTNIGNWIGDSRNATFPVAGTFTYFCGIHPGMTGTVIVH